MGGNSEEYIIEYELADDLQSFISTQTEDVTFEKPEMKDKIFDFNPMEVLEVTKSIGSPTKIIDINKVDDEFIEKCI